MNTFTTFYFIVLPGVVVLHILSLYHYRAYTHYALYMFSLSIHMRYIYVSFILGQRKLNHFFAGQCFLSFLNKQFRSICLYEFHCLCKQIHKNAHTMNILYEINKYAPSTIISMLSVNKL